MAAPAFPSRSMMSFSPARAAPQVASTSTAAHKRFVMVIPPFARARVGDAGPPVHGVPGKDAAPTSTGHRVAGSSWAGEKLALALFLQGIPLHFNCHRPETGGSDD